MIPVAFCPTCLASAVDMAMMYQEGIPTPLEYLAEFREEFPNATPHHLIRVGRGFDRKENIPQHYTVYPCLTQEEHDMAHAPVYKNPEFHLKMWTWVVKRLMNLLYQESLHSM